jgi:hypothetical protein
MWIASAIKFFLIVKSRGVSVVNEGDWFTSSSQDLPLESMKMSKPRIWKHIEFSKSSGFELLCKCAM